jgi:DNA polymerase-1
MAQNFLFGNLPELKSSKEQDKALLQKSKNVNKSQTRTVRTAAATKANKWATRVAVAVEEAKKHLKDDGSILTVRDEKTFFDYIEKTAEIGIAGLDSETTGLDPIIDKLVGLCLYAKDEKQSIYVPVGHTDFEDNLLPDQLSFDVIREGLEILKRKKTKLVFHNGKFDNRIFWNNLGIDVPIYWCTELAASYLNENEIHKLKPLWDKYVNKGNDKSLSYGELFKGIPFNYIPIHIASLYAGKDPKITLELHEYQYQFLNPESEKCKEKGLEDAGRFLIQVEIPLIRHVARMEDRGVEIEDTKAQELSEKYGGMIKEVEERCHKFLNSLDYSKLSPDLRSKLGNPINLNSPPQLSIVLYDVLELKSPDKRNPRGTGEEILLALKEEGHYPEFFDNLLEYRELAKLLSTYIDKLPRVRNPKTNRIHTNFNQYGAKTGRFSSSDPNLQNIPSKNKDIRKMFKARDGYVLIGADFSQQEPRVLAHLCYVLFGDTRMMDAYMSGKDLYAWMASEVYQTEYDLCKEKLPDGTLNPEGKKRRDSVKDIVLGLMYGRQVKSIAEKLGVSVAEAQKIVDMLFNTFPAIKQVVDYYINMAVEKGYVQTVYGRKRRLPDIQLPLYEFVHTEDRDRYVEDEQIIQHYLGRLSRANTWKKKQEIYQDANKYGIWIIDNSMTIADAERQTLNSVVQGTSADITKKAMLAIGESEELKALDFHMVLTVHDEIIGECPIENALKAKDIMTRLMIECCKDRILVPMKCDAEITYIWYGEDLTEELSKSA